MDGHDVRIAVVMSDDEYDQDYGFAGYRIAIDRHVIEVFCERCGFLPPYGPVFGAAYDGFPLELFLRDAFESVTEHELLRHDDPP
jgi:hypothetical protein